MCLVRNPAEWLPGQWMLSTVDYQVTGGWGGERVGGGTAEAVVAYGGLRGFMGVYGGTLQRPRVPGQHQGIPRRPFSASTVGRLFYSGLLLFVGGNGLL